MTEYGGEQPRGAIPWRVDRRDGVNRRRNRAGARTIAYFTTVADAEHIGREAVIRLITTAIAYGKGGRI